jgi:hypothetical protein
MKMFIKITEIHHKKAEEEREKEKENDTEKDEPYELWTPEPSGDY